MNEISTLNFERAGRAVIEFLHRRLGFGLWMVTRTRGDDWIVLQAEDHGYSVSAGSEFRWADSFCSEMVKGNGPRMAPSSDKVPAYRSAAIGQQVPIEAYIGVPLTNGDGTLFGTLCAIDPMAQPDAIVAEQELVELLAQLLSTILSAELTNEVEVRRSERLAVDLLVDQLTGLSNRRAWDQLLAKEEERCFRYGHSAAVVAIDIDGLKAVNDLHGHAAGDALIVRTAEALREAARDTDVVARLGGDEFGMVAVECDRNGVAILVARMRAALATRSVSASVGVSMRQTFRGLAASWEEADARMYEEKRSADQKHSP